MTPDEARIVENLTSHMTPRCVGRYLIDLPDKFVLNEISRAIIEGVTIDVVPMKKSDFDLNISVRRKILMGEKIIGEDTPSLMATRELANGEGYVFDRSKDKTSPVLRTWELMAWSNGYSISMTIESANTGLSRHSYPADAQEDNVQEKLNKLLEVYKRTRGRRDDDIPAEQGVCFANGFVKGPPTDQDWIDMYHHWEGVPDVYASFSYMSDIGKLGTSLLQRGKDIEKALSNENGKTLRKGARSTNGLEFEEWLYQTQPEPKEPMLFDMTAEMNSKGGNAQHPLLVFGLVSGDKHPRPSPTLEQAALEKPLEKVTLNAAQTVALWDKISATLRKRPGAF
jgi:hypothetical protein